MKALIYITIATVLLSGCENKLKEQQHTRHIELEGEPNFRDIGGHQTEDGKTVKWGQIYRTGKLSKLTDADVEILDGLNIKTVVNFLTPKELEHDGIDRLPAGAKTIYNPIEVGGDWAAEIVESRKTGDFSKVSTDLNPGFHRMLADEAQEEYAKLFRAILDEDNQPLVFHCSHGVHRTGTAAARAGS